MTASPPPFGRTPRGIYVVAGLLGAAAVLATFASVVPWYVDNGTSAQAGGYNVYSQYFTPGPGGYIHTCSTYVTSNATVCVSFSYNYSAGSGTGVISALYDGLLGTSVATAVLAFAGAFTISAGLQGRVRARTTRRLVIMFVAVALCAAATSTILLPAYQGSAYTGFAGCPGFNGTASPCNSFVGHASCLDGSGTSCAASNLSWYPEEGWYIAIASVGVLCAGLVALHFQPLGNPCPFCGTPNRFPARYCDTCGRALPAVEQKESVGYRI
ncbi:MAG TPA: hypothetical protein VEG66_01090 [Thermoplasmata archaeon]|jgi:hypothetical protein|nr:hypothetical protein [Thermoplasmata archaeon]